MSFVLKSPTVGAPQPIAAEQVHVWAWQLPLSFGAHDSVNAYEELLDEEERHRFHRFHFDRDRVAFAVSHANLRGIIGSYLDRDPKCLVFRRNTFGKPELNQEVESLPLFFNLSHSRNVALLALSMDMEVGVDIEDIQMVDCGLAESHFSPLELSALSLLKGERWLRGFYNCWTRKEAILKAEGVGLNLELDSFDVSLIPDAPARLLGIRPAANFRYLWALHNLSIDSDTIAALATGSARAKVSCFRLDAMALATRNKKPSHLFR